MFSRLKAKNCLIALLGSTILAFGLYHIHSFSGVTEGGVLGLTLWLHHHFDISPAISGYIISGLCYLLGWKVLGKEFIGYSLVATTGYSLAYKIFESFPPLWPNLYQYPLFAAIVGAIFVGVGVGLAVGMGGAPGGDDALAMSLVKVTPLTIQQAYLISDLVVLALSITYIPLHRLWYSLITVTLSGWVVKLVADRVSRFRAEPVPVPVGD